MSELTYKCLTAQESLTPLENLSYPVIIIIIGIVIFSLVSLIVKARY